MRLTKYIHSCLLLEKENFKLLIDPGTFTFAEGVITPESLADAEAIIITHNHPDHLDTENLKAILDAGNAKVYTNKEVAAILEQAGISSEFIPSKIGPFDLQVFPVKHQPLLDAPEVIMYGFVIDGKILNAVDSFESSLDRFKGIEWLVLPVMAPFATELDIAAYADRLQPKHILPVHDGFAKPFFLTQRYQNYEKHFEKQGITFHWLKEPGDGIDIK